MIILYLIAIILVCGSFFEYFICCLNTNSTNLYVCKNSSLNRLIFCMMTILLIMLSALRGTNVGTDLMNYIPRYKILGETDWSQLYMQAILFKMEFGFCIFNKVLYIINPNPRLFLVVTSVVIGIGFYKMASYSKMPIFTYLIIYMFGFWGSSLNIVRQFLALSILTFGYDYIINRSFLKFLVIVLLASFFHSSAVVSIPLFFFYKVKFDLKNFILTFISVVFISGMLMLIWEPLIDLTDYGRYLNRGYQGSGFSTFLLVINLLIFSCLYYKCLKIKDKNLDLWLAELFYSAIFLLLAMKNGIFARVIKYFLPCMAILTPNIIFSLKRNKLQCAICYAIVILFFISYFLLVFVDKQCVGDKINEFVILENELFY